MDKALIIFLVTMGMLLIVFAVIFWEWRRNDKPAKEILDAWHDDPANWKLGFLYYNKEDKRLFPPKRLYMGWTINFANPVSVIALVLLIIIPGLVVYILQRQ